MRIALLFICLNPRYWTFMSDVTEGARKHFLKNHQVDMFLWSDIGSSFPEITYGCEVFETEAVDWPLPTLMRYHLFLQQEEKLKDYDYIFYCDADMMFVDTVGDEILGDGLTAAQHPMYAFRQGLSFPVEPNPESAAFIPLPKHYYAGGFQGGRAKDFLEAMKVMKRAIDADFMKNYIARWNDESHWNRYLFDNPPSVVLDPGYVYPDEPTSIRDYYIPIWGRDYPKKMLALIKKFSLSKEGGEQLSSISSGIKQLK